MPDPVRVAIFGTSNSIMRVGYVTGLAETNGIVITANRSMGSSHSTFLPMFMHDDVLARSDVAVLDTAINEGRAIATGKYNLDLARDLFLYALMRCALHDVMPVVLLLPGRDVPDGYAAQQMYVALCAQYGVPFFDGYAATRALPEAQAGPWETLFKDKWHLLPEIAKKVGAELGRRLLRYGRVTGAARNLSGRNFYSVPAAPYAAAGQLVARKTSLFDTSLVRLLPGDSIAVPLPEGDEIAGMTLAMSHCCANVRIDGARTLVKRLNNAFYAPDKLRMASWQVMSPVAAGEWPTVLTCLADTDHEDAGVDCNDHFLPAAPPRPEPAVEIASLIVRSSLPLNIRWRGYAEPNLLA